MLQLFHTKHVRVEKYGFLKFGYMTRERLDRIGKPSSVVRDRKSEEWSLANAPEGTRIECYAYDYDKQGLVLGLVFDKNRESVGEPFIGLAYIVILPPR